MVSWMSLSQLAQFTSYPMSSHLLSPLWGKLKENCDQLQDVSPLNTSVSISQIGTLFYIILGHYYM